MHLLYLTEYFQTPDEAGLMRTWEISRHLVEKGHRVSVIAPAAHHMSGQHPGSLEGRFRLRTVEAGIEVTRVRTMAGFRRGYLARVLYYLSTPLAIIMAALRTKPDVVMASSPPFFLGAPAYALARLKKVPFVLEVRDAWLEFAIAKRLLPGWLGAVLERQQAWLFRRADRIVAVTPGIKDLVLETLGPAGTEKTSLVMNGYEEDIFTGLDRHLVDRLKNEWELAGKFVVIYAGTLGMARDGMIFVQAAARLRSHRDIVFVIIGEGESKAAMEQFVSANQLDNCRFVSMRPRREMPAWFALGSVGLNSIRAGEALESSLSNKIFDYLGSGLPVVFSGGGDTSDFLRRSGSGLIVDAGDADAMAAAILSLYRNPALRRRLSRAGQAFVREHYSRPRLVAPLETMLLQLSARGPSIGDRVDPVENQA